MSVETVLPAAPVRPPPAHALHEAARLAALRSYGVLEREDLAGLDRLAEYAASRFGQALAAVTFVAEDRLWFGGACGLASRLAARGGSFCDETIRHSSPLLVPDALSDPRFCAHELVRGPHAVRSYAGVRLEDQDGYRLGAVCVFGRTAGPFDPRLVRELAALARLTEAYLVSGLAEHAAPEGAGPAPVQGWLGVRTLGSHGQEAGLIVLSVARGSPAAQAGLRPTDVLYAIDHHVLRRPGDVARALARRPPGALARVQFQRAGALLECLVPVGPAPSPASRR